jgi:hypothetical protein
MKILKIISEHKRIHFFNSWGKPIHPPKKGWKRVEAIVSYGGEPVTRHIDIPR